MTGPKTLLLDEESLERPKLDYSRIADMVDTCTPFTAERRGWRLHGLDTPEDRPFLIARAAIEYEAHRGGYVLLRASDCKGRTTSARRTGASARRSSLLRRHGPACRCS